MQKTVDILKNPSSTPFLLAAMAVFLNFLPTSQIDNRANVESMFSYGWAFSAVLTDKLSEFVESGIPTDYLGPYTQEATVGVFIVFLQQLGYTEAEATRITTAKEPHIFRNAFAAGMDCGLKFLEYYVEHA